MAQARRFCTFAQGSSALRHGRGVQVARIDEGRWVMDRVSRLLAGAALGCGLAWAPAAAAQGAPVVSRPVVQQLPGADSKRLASALATLGRNPRDVAALIEAGDAARGMQDFEAAAGFYRRADEISPGNARVKAGLGSSFALSGDPVSAIPLFDAAEKAGATPALISADRGLAYDLVGDNAAAQRHYALALATSTGAAGDELRTRLAVSQAISGQGDAAYATLLPLLNKQDKPGWRTRAFTLAIAGDTGEAVDVAQKILPAPLADNIAPYLRYMPRLTKAQQAAAANLGRFPRASEVGRDDARIAAYAPPRSSAAGSGLIPKGEPLGGGTKLANAPPKKPARAARGAASRTRAGSAQPSSTVAAPARDPSLAVVDPDRVAPPEVRPAIERDGGELPAVGRRIELPSVAQPAHVATASPTTAVAAASSASAAPAAPAPASTSVSARSPAAVQAPTPGFDLARVTAGPPSAAPATGGAVAAQPPAGAAAPAVASPPSQPVAAPAQRSLADIFADLGRPAVEAAPVSGAVDIRMITPAPPPPVAPVATKAEPLKAADAEPRKSTAVAETKAKDAKTKAADAKAAAEGKAKAKAKKPTPPAHPSRIWVQIGVGRDKDAIAFDWRRYNREAPALFKGRQPFVSEMGRTNRVLVGPFATQKAATAFLADAKKQGFGDALPWTSPAGQVVDALSGK
jgi:tetratricopeptide (TPR) repeat protein